MKVILLANDNTVVLSENPAEWVVIKSHTSSLSNTVGYVTSVLFNGVEMTGIDFRMNVFGPVDLPSLCFEIIYEENLSRFIVKTYGQGYGIGISQVAAKQLATEEYTYKEILAKYYEGTTIVEEANV